MPQVPFQEFPDTKGIQHLNTGGSLNNSFCSTLTAGSEPQLECDTRHLGIESEPLQSVVTALRAPNLSHLSLDIPSQTCIKLLLKCADFVRPATTLDIRRSRGCYCAAVNLRKLTWPRLHTLQLRDPSFPNLRNLFGIGPRIIPELCLLEILYMQQILLTVEEEDWVRWNMWDLNLALEEGINCYVLEEHIKRVFQDFYPSPALTFSRTKNGRNRGALRSRVDFFDINSAEKGLAIHHLRPILGPPGPPSVLLKFSTAPTPKPFSAPDVSVLPRLIKKLPSGCTEATLYDLLRPYGPIYSVRIHPVAGGLVQFLDAACARDAEIGLAPKMILKPYDPCSLFCSNLNFALDAWALRSYFEVYGNITNAVIFTDTQTGTSRGQGFITFSQASEASDALLAMHGVAIGWKFLSVSYYWKIGERVTHSKSASKGVGTSVREDEVLHAEEATAYEKPHPTIVGSETTPAASKSKKKAKRAKKSISKAVDVDGQTKPDSREFHATGSSDPTPAPSNPILTPSRPSAEASAELKTEIYWLVKLGALEALYDAEKERRTSCQRENERLRAELASAKLQEDGGMELLQEELQSVKLQSEAEIELLREKLDTTKRALVMAESRLKILQLEADRPLWEAAKKKREEKERAKEEERRRAAELEESRRKMREIQEQERARKRAAEEAERKERLRLEAEEKARREAEERERKQRQKEELARKAREALERLERQKRWQAATLAEEARCRIRDEKMWGLGVWTPTRALERLKIQIEEFDKIKFSEAQPLTFRVIPWPVLIDPLALDIEQITWEAVEAFSIRAKILLAANVAEYNRSVEKVHRLFHPDKWRSRNLLVTVMDEELRKRLETAGNVVAQAMTPIWRKSRGYTDA
ncbi:hypothetical protein K438DRAFT_2006981 [Mycena galopus ATCC 62051]|nr:hypothetical protein K438DRAFT_2006981 [Mycena galopus ATCC 62051]